MVPDLITAAEYTRTRAGGLLEITVISGGRRLHTGRQFTCSGKREARRIAMEQGAKPWNF